MCIFRLPDLEFEQAFYRDMFDIEPHDGETSTGLSSHAERSLRFQTTACSGNRPPLDESIHRGAICSDSSRNRMDGGDPLTCLHQVEEMMAGESDGLWS